MVVAPKRNSEVRICIDLTVLNQIVREGELSTTKGSGDIGDVGSRMDTNSGFGPLEFDIRLCHLTTFITPFR